MILPNQLTTLRIILTPFFLLFFLMEDPLYKQISVVIFIIAALTDWYDGWLARKFNYITDWGKFMDPLADKFLTSAAFFSFVVFDILPLWMVVTIVVRDFLVTILRSIADIKKKPFTTSYIAKWKTFAQMAFLYFLLTVYTLTTFEEFYSQHKDIIDSLLYSDIIFYLMLFITLFTIFTGITYLFENRRLIKELFLSGNKQN